MGKVRVLIFILLWGSLIPTFATNKISFEKENFVANQISTIGATTVIVELNALGLNGLGVAANHDVLRMNSIKAAAESFKQLLPSQAMQKKVIHQYQYVPGVVVEVDSEMLAELKNNQYVKAIYPNKRLKPSLAESVELVYPTHDRSEFHGNNEWVIAVLDTGVDKNHSFLMNGSTRRVISEACYSGGGFIGDPRVDSLCPGNVASSIASNSGLYCTGYVGCEHGTHVAGIAAGDTGVANNAKLIAIQVFTGIQDPFNENICGTVAGNSCILAFDSDLIKGLERVYALRNTYKIAAVNMSLGGGQFFSACNSENALMTNIIANLKTADIATVIASGNESYNNAINFPACISAATAVGATYDSGSLLDQVAFYSNSSSMVDVVAPGSYIDSSVPGGGIVEAQGTSMAAPHVAGAFAVLKHAMPTESAVALESMITSQGPEVLVGSVYRHRLDISKILKNMGFGLPIISPVLYLLLDG